MSYNWRQVDQLTSDWDFWSFPGNDFGCWMRKNTKPLPPIYDQYTFGIMITVCHRLHCGCSCVHSKSLTFFKPHDPATGDWPVADIVAGEYGKRFLENNAAYTQLARSTMSPHAGTPFVRFCALITDQPPAHCAEGFAQMDEGKFAGEL